LTPKFIYSAAPQKDQILELKKFCSSDFFDLPLLPFFSREAINFLNELSSKILKRPDIRSFPELLALAFWLRKGNLVPIFQNWQNKVSKEEKVFARGVAFHIAPSNVDSIFLYSWALSLLSGNSNLVRVSRTRSNQLEILFEIINKLYKTHKKIACRNKLFTYEHDEDISSYLSVNSDLRIIWGGDETISLIKKLQSKTTTKDVTFSDKSSLAIINTKSYLSLDKNARNELAHSFFNDSYWFSQKACSSPGRVYFIGNHAAETSKIFWKQLGLELIKNGSLDDVSLSIKKLTSVFQEIIDNDDIKPLIIGKNDHPTVLLQESGSPIHPSCGGGFFIERRLSNLNELPMLLRTKDQTLSYYGFSSEILNEICQDSLGLGLDRIVPIGHALNFHPVWDGYDLLTEFTKRLTLL